MINDVQVLKFHVTRPEGTTSNWTFTQWMLDNRRSSGLGVNREPDWQKVAVPLIPWILVFLFVCFFLFRQLRKQAAVSPAPMRVFVVNQSGFDPSAPPPTT